jgi:NADH dehydrogenase FAD-containing subunit
VDLVSFRIIQGGASILPVFDAAMQTSGLEALQSQGIEVMLNRKVMKVEEKHIELDGGELLPYGLCVWAAGTAPRDITKNLIASIPELAASTAGKRGRLAVDKWLRLRGTNGTIVALGDAVEVDDLQLPPTGQVAAQHGAFLGRLLNREYDLSTPVPTFDLDKVNPLEKVANFVRLRGRLEAQAFSFLNLGLLAYVGSANALAQVQTGNIKLGDYSSRAGNLLWRSVYLVKQVSTRNRVLVLNDWLRTRVFGRDISRF